MSERVQKYLSVLELSYCRDAISFRHSETDFLFYNKMKKEIWKDIKGFEGQYRVSNFGNVKSLGNDRTRKEKHLRSHINFCGYLQITLCKNRYVNTFRINRLVALHFVPNLKNKPCVNHKDGNKLNNKPSNLEWVTYSENTKHAFKIGLKNHKGDNHPLRIRNRRIELTGKFKKIKTLWKRKLKA